MTYFSDGVGNVCAFDLPDFPIIYYTSLNDAVRVGLCSQKDCVYLPVQRLVIQF